jgi:hypothetical protein
MTGRPCKPGSDLHGLWRLLLPGTAFPACGVADNAAADTSARPETATGADDKTSHGISDWQYSLSARLLRLW